MPNKNWQKPALGEGKKNGREGAYAKAIVKKYQVIRAVRGEKIEVIMLSLSKISEHGKKNMLKKIALQTF